MYRRVRCSLRNHNKKSTCKVKVRAGTYHSLDPLRPEFRPWPEEWHVWIWVKFHQDVRMRLERNSMRLERNSIGIQVKFHQDIMMRFKWNSIKIYWWDWSEIPSGYSDEIWVKFHWIYLWYWSKIPSGYTHWFLGTILPMHVVTNVQLAFIENRQTISLCLNWEDGFEFLNIFYDLHCPIAIKLERSTLKEFVTYINIAVIFPAMDRKVIFWMPRLSCWDQKSCDSQNMLAI